jgi:hypothetical protein
MRACKILCRLRMARRSSPRRARDGRPVPAAPPPRGTHRLYDRGVRPRDAPSSKYGKGAGRLTRREPAGRSAATSVGVSNRAAVGIYGEGSMVSTKDSRILEQPIVVLDLAGTGTHEADGHVLERGTGRLHESMVRFDDARDKRVTTGLQQAMARLSCRAGAGRERLVTLRLIVLTRP